MPSRSLAVLLLFLALLTTADRVHTRSGGVLPANPPKLTRATPSCGTCHSPTSPSGPKVDVAVGSYVLPLSGKTTITVSARVANAPRKKGGFAADVTVGKLVGGTGTKVSTDGLRMTHSQVAVPKWSIGYTAANKAGLVEFYTVVNTVNDDGYNMGDAWAFHTAVPSDAFSTPVRMFVNAAGVAAVGSSCADGHGNRSVLGSSSQPVGGAAFVLEAHGLPPAQAGLFLAGANSAFRPVDLTPFGAGGCLLVTDLWQVLPLTTTGTNSQRNRRMANGTWRFQATLPSLKGLFLAAQLLVRDADSSRGWQIVMTNGLRVTVP